MSTADPSGNDTPSGRDPAADADRASPWHQVLSRLDNVHHAGETVTARCPAHDDQRNSLSVATDEDGTVLLHCFVGCSAEQIVSAIGLSLADLFPPNRTPSIRRGLTVEHYALAKRLPPDFLKERFKLRTTRRKDQLCVAMPGFDADGQHISTNYRMKLAKTDGIDDRFDRRKGDPAIPYGLWRLAEARERGYLTLVEGESDVQTLAFYDEPALGVAGANSWKEVRDAPALDAIETIYLVVERDRGGVILKTSIAQSSIRPRVRTIDLGELKDPSGLHCDAPDRFQERWEAAKAAAVPLPDPEDTTAEDTAAAFALARDLLRAPDLLDQIAAVVTARGYAGDTKPPLAGYIAITSRLLSTPMNLAFVAPSGAGKNRAVDEACALIPEEAVYIIKAASERALIYNQEQFEHRTVIFAEADSIPEEGPAASAVRNLATDNLMEYEVTIRDEQTGDFTTRLIRKPGPTGLITTSIKSPGEQLGTRLLEIAILDDEAQTRAVMQAQARRAMAPITTLPDLAPFLALQRYLDLRGIRQVAVPFARVLAELVPASAVRTRRDFPQLLTAIQAIAFLYQEQRERTPDGWVLATIEDYAHAREIFATCFDVLAADGVTPRIRDLVAAVPEEGGATLHELAVTTGLAESTVSYHVARAIKRGWLTNDAPRGRRGYKLRRGSPLPEATSALPDPEDLREIFESSKADREVGGPPLDDDAGDDIDPMAPSSPNDPTDPPAHPPTPSPGGDASSRLVLEDSKISVVPDATTLGQALSALHDTAVVGIDTETTGLDPRRDCLRLVTVATPKMTLVIDIAVIPDWRRMLTPLLLNPAITKVFHHAKFDLAFLATAGLDVENIFDTMLAAQLLDGGRHLATKDFFTLAALVQRELGLVLPKDLQASVWSGSLSDEQVAYAARDAAVLVPLRDKLAASLAVDGLRDVAALEFSALPALVWLETAGAPMDVAAWMTPHAAATAALAVVDAELAMHLPGVNVNSHRQLRAALTALGIHIPDTKETTLQNVVGQHPVVAGILRRKELHTRTTTYGDAYLKYVDPTTGRIHASYRQIGAASGRMACSRPNLQNIPRDPAYRRCFRPRAGRVLVKADYAQIELRIAAQLTRDPALVAAFRAGEDLHAATARAVLGREPTRDDRQLAKALNFGLLYGMGSSRLRDYAASDYGVTLSDDQAAQFRGRFFAVYAGLRDWHRQQSEGQSSTRTLGGRVRLSVSRFTEKLNSPVQGTGADILKSALARLWADRAAVPSATPVLVIHDEIVVEVDIAEAEACVAWLRAHMTGAGEAFVPDVPIVVDAQIAADWSGTPVAADAAD